MTLALLLVAPWILASVVCVVWFAWDCHAWRREQRARLEWLERVWSLPCARERSVRR